MTVAFTWALKTAKRECWLCNIQFTYFIQCVFKKCKLSGLLTEGGPEDAVLLEGSCLSQVPVWTGKWQISWLTEQVRLIAPACGTSCSGRLMASSISLSFLLQAQPDLPEKEKCLVWITIFWLWRSSWTLSRVGLFWKLAPMKVRHMADLDSPGTQPSGQNVFRTQGPKHIMIDHRAPCYGENTKILGIGDLSFSRSVLF